MLEEESDPPDLSGTGCTGPIPPIDLVLEKHSSSKRCVNASKSRSHLLFMCCSPNCGELSASCADGKYQQLQGISECMANTWTCIWIEFLSFF